MRNLYYAKLNHSKKEVPRSNTSDCHGDSKSLHKLVNNLTIKTVENPLPAGKSDADLADNFASYFENKILTIREMFNGIA